MSFYAGTCPFRCVPSKDSHDGRSVTYSAPVYEGDASRSTYSCYITVTFTTGARTNKAVTVMSSVTGVSPCGFIPPQDSKM